MKNWLIKNNLEEYHDVFKHHETNLKTLLLLSKGTLINMGIDEASCNKILKAIEQHTDLEHSQTNTTQTPELNSQKHRRNVAYLICDVVNSTQYITNTDMEDSDQHSERYNSIFRQIAAKYSGYYIRSTGDGAEIVFGYPNAIEDYVELALRCGLRLISEISNIKMAGFEPIALRVGVSCDIAILSDLDQTDIPPSSRPFGRVAYKAKSIQKAANPNTLFVDSDTYFNARDLFAFSDKREVELGKFGMAEIWQVINKNNYTSRFDKRANKTKFVGRQQELERLNFSYQNLVRNQQGGTIGIQGPAGIGKSRLVSEFLNQTSEDKVTLQLFQCSPRKKTSPYHPIISHIKDAYDLMSGDNANNKVNLEGFISNVGLPVDKALSIFANLFDVNIGTQLDSGISKELQEKLVIDGLTAYLTESTSSEKKIVFIEDIHWLDRHTFEIIQLISNLATKTVLIILTSRHLEDLNRFSNASFLSFTLDRLKDSEISKIITSLPIAKELTAPQITQIEQHSEGNPFYAEELALGIQHTSTNSLSLVKGTGRKDKIELSSVLQAMLLGRLDELNNSKEIAQIAALIGRTFEIDILQKVTQIPLSSLGHSLSQLRIAEIIDYQEEERTASFRHALMQESAISLLLNSTKKKLHKEIATVLVKRSDTTISQDADVIAEHFHQAECFIEAAEHWLIHGKKLATTWAKEEAVDTFYNALNLIRGIEVTDTKAALELELLVESGDALYAKYGYITNEAMDAYEQALDISKRTNNYNTETRIYDGLFGINFNAGNFHESDNYGKKMEALSHSYDFLPAKVLGIQFQGMSQYHLGNFSDAEKLLENCLSYISDAEEVGSDFPSMPYLYLSWTKLKVGNHTEAIKLFENATEVVKHQIPYRQAACLGDGCVLFSMLGDTQRTSKLSTELISLAEEYGFDFWGTYAQFFNEWVNSKNKDKSAIKKMQQLVDSLADHKCDKTLFLLLLAKSYYQYSNPKKAKKLIDEAYSLIDETNERCHLHEINLFSKKLEDSLGEFTL